MAGTDTAEGRRADDDLATGATVTIAQFRAVLQGFPETRPWGATRPDVEVRAMTSPIKLSQHAQRDLRGLFGRPAMPKILAALDRLAAAQAPTYLVAGVTQARAYPSPTGWTAETSLTRRPALSSPCRP